MQTGVCVSYPKAGQDERTVREYVIARLDKNLDLAYSIWNANPNLQDKMIVAMLAEKEETQRYVDYTKGIPV